MIRVTHPFEMLNALSILCQGWIGAIKQGNAEKCAEVKQARWWDVFDLWLEDDEFSTENWQNLVMNLLDQPGITHLEDLPDELANLKNLLCLIRDDGQIDDAGLVNRAFSEIMGHLPRWG